MIWITAKMASFFGRFELLECDFEVGRLEHLCCYLNQFFELDLA